MAIKIILLVTTFILVLVVLTQQIIQVRKRKHFYKLVLGKGYYFLNKAVCMSIKYEYFIWYVIVADWQETFRSVASRLAGDFAQSFSPTWVPYLHVHLPLSDSEITFTKLL